MTLRKMIKDSPRIQAAMDETFEIAVDEAANLLYEGLRNQLYAASRDYLQRHVNVSLKASGFWSVIEWPLSQYPTDSSDYFR
jgi:hypothetical protein